MRNKISKWVVIPLALLLFGFGNLMGLEKKELTLEDAILIALKNNLNLAVEVLNPELSHLSVKGAWERFYPTISFSYNKRSTQSASYSFLDASEVVDTSYNDYSVTLSQFLPTGGNLSVSLTSDETESNRNFQTINPRFGSTLRFNLTQPLLKNAGFKINRREIIIAKNNREMSKKRLKSLLLDTIYQVEEAYWNLVYSVENLKVREQSLALAKELLAKNKKSVEIGSLAPIEVKTAEAEVATREADILDAEALISNNTDRLKNILNLNASRGSAEIDLVPLDHPITEKRGIALEEAVEMAFKNRPDMEEQKIDLENKKVDLSYAKNQVLPELNLQASYWSPGISGTQILYQGGNPLTGIVIGTLPGGSSDSMKDALNFLYNNWSISLNLDIPLSNVFSRSTLARAVVTMDQAQLSLLAKEQQVLLEIKTAVRTLETNFKRVKAYRVARELTEDKLKAEEEKLRVGLSTNYNLLMAQRDFENARSSELMAVIDYSLSVANLDKVLGVSLKEKNIKFNQDKK